MGKRWVTFHSSFVRHGYKFDSTKHKSYDPYFQPLHSTKKKRMACILYISILLVMGLSTFNGPFIIWNYFIKMNSPYSMPHVVFKCTKWPPLWTSSKMLKYCWYLFKIKNNRIIVWEMNYVTWKCVALNYDIPMINYN